MYLVTLVGNLLIIQAPMYFFLAILSFINTCFSCSIVPKVLVNIQTQHHTMFYAGWLLQIYFFMALALLDDSLLAVMAYDRYMIICLPLHYPTILCTQCCLGLVAASWLCSHLLAFSLTLLMSQFSLCASHSIPCFCDFHPLLKLACSDTHIFQATVSSPFWCGPSNLCPGHLYTILRVPSAWGKQKVFSACGSHLSAVTLFYGTVFLAYFHPSSSYSADTGMMAPVVYTVATPILNPFIYSLFMNRDMKGALWRLFSWARCSTP